MTLQDQRTSGQLQLRYEDVAQDGRIMLQTLPVALGVIWRAIALPREARRAMRDQGIVPIMTRYVLAAQAGPFSIENPVDVRGGFTLAHSVDASEKVDRLYLDMDAELTAPIGRTNLQPPGNAGETAPVGTVRAEHVFTRPFAPPGDRKVLALEAGAGPFVPETRRTWHAPVASLEPPPLANAIDVNYTEDATRFVFGTMHTDSNQHVNSLVYPRLFEEAALRRFRALGRPTNVLARTLDISYRRPSFAGDAVRVFVRAFDNAATGYFFGENDDITDIAKARAFVRMTFE